MQELKSIFFAQRQKRLQAPSPGPNTSKRDTINDTRMSSQYKTLEPLQSLEKDPVAGSFVLHDGSNSIGDSRFQSVLAVGHGR